MPILEPTCPFMMHFPVVPTSYTLISITEQPQGIRMGSLKWI